MNLFHGFKNSLKSTLIYYILMIMHLLSIKLLHMQKAIAKNSTFLKYGMFKTLGEIFSFSKVLNISLILSSTLMNDVCWVVIHQKCFHHRVSVFFFCSDMIEMLLVQLVTSTPNTIYVFILPIFIFVPCR